jgi:hypothetical protein
MSKELIEQLAKEHCETVFMNSFDGTIVNIEFTGEQLEAFAKAYQAAAPIDNVREAYQHVYNLIEKELRNGQDGCIDALHVMAEIRALIPSTQAPNTSGVRDETK